MTFSRIVSFLPAATEMICALGLADRLVGISAACDFPPEIRDRPVVVRGAINTEGMDSMLIDQTVRQRKHNGDAMFVVNEELLAELKPDLILTQDLCHVCAPSGNELQVALDALGYKPEIMVLSPGTLTEIAQNLRELGDLLDRHNEAEVLLIEWKARVDDVQMRVNRLPRVRCVVLEWIDPLYCSGHWVAEMVQMAGGYDLLAHPGQDSTEITWEEVRAAAPDVLILAPCGYNVDQATDELPKLKLLPGWDEIPAVKSKKVYAANASAFLTRPGPRVVDGIEMLAYLLHL